MLAVVYRVPVVWIVVLFCLVWLLYCLVVTMVWWCYYWQLFRMLQLWFCFVWCDMPMVWLLGNTKYCSTGVFFFWYDIGPKNWHIKVSVLYFSVMWYSLFVVMYVVAQAVQLVLRNARCVAKRLSKQSKCLWSDNLLIYLYSYIIYGVLQNLWRTIFKLFIWKFSALSWYMRKPKK